MRTSPRFLALASAVAVALSGLSLHAASGWLGWRGPDQNGVSPAKQALVTDLSLGGPNDR